MIATSSWDVGVTITSSYEFYPAPLPTPHIAEIYDTGLSPTGITLPEIISVVKSIGGFTNEVRGSRGIYAKIQRNNAYDVGVLDTIINVINNPTPTPTPTPTMTPTPSMTFYVVDNLLLYLDPSNPTSYPGSGTTITDLSGNGYNGTLTNGPTYSTSNGGVIVFDGSNDNISVSGLDLRRNFSLELWVKFNSLSTSQGLFGQGIAAANQGMHIFQSGNSIEYRLYFSDYARTATTTTGQWYQYVFTYSHTSPYTKQIYRNGVLLGTSTSGQGQWAGTGAFRIGHTYSNINPADPLNGSVGLARAYSKILSAPEVLQNYNNDRARFGL